jgi:putative phosphoribosyl transferase
MQAASSKATAAARIIFRFFTLPFVLFAEFNRHQADAPIEKTESSIDFSVLTDDQYPMFASREDAGRKLGHHLLEKEIRPDIVLGLPRGGVVVAAVVANILQVPLDVVIVRKIGHPLHREFAVGALAEPDVVVLDDSVVGRNPLVRMQLKQVIAEEQERLEKYGETFHRDGLPDFANKSVLLVDDGLATGATTEAAVEAVRRKEARRVIVAAPVASTNAVERLSRVADDVRIIIVDPDFDAVGRYYESFSQTTDEEVLNLLHARVPNHHSA